MHYILAEANQNRFVLFDCFENSTLSPAFYAFAHRCLVNEGRDDALILMEGQKGIVKMQVLGLDGSFGEFCGNGALACASYLYNRFPEEEEFFLKTAFGLHPLLKEERNFSITLPRPTFEINRKFILSEAVFKDHFAKYAYVEVIEPHLVIEAKLSAEELFNLGRTINQRKELFPHGINVNAWHCIDTGIKVLTYERGVQRLTQSCGTGSIACVAALSKESVQVTTLGGILKVSFSPEQVKLAGSAFFYDKERRAK